MKKDIEHLLNEAGLILEQAERMRYLYKRLDQIYDHLITQEAAVLANGWRFKNNFEENNVVFRTHGIRQFELEYIGKPKAVTKRKHVHKAWEPKTRRNR